MSATQLATAMRPAQIAPTTAARTMPRRLTAGGRDPRITIVSFPLGFDCTRRPDPREGRGDACVRITTPCQHSRIPRGPGMGDAPAAAPVAAAGLAVFLRHPEPGAVKT